MNIAGFKKEHKNYNSKPIKYKGDIYLARELAEFDECKVGVATLRANILLLRNKVFNGKAKFCDEEVEKCMHFKEIKRKTKEEMKMHTILRELKEKEKLEIDNFVWKLLNKLWKAK